MTAGVARTCSRAPLASSRFSSSSLKDALTTLVARTSQVGSVAEGRVAWSARTAAGLTFSAKDSEDTRSGIMLRPTVASETRFTPAHARNAIVIIAVRGNVTALDHDAEVAVPPASEGVVKGRSQRLDPGGREDGVHRDPVPGRPAAEHRVLVAAYDDPRDDRSGLRRPTGVVQRVRGSGHRVAVAMNEQQASTADLIHRL